jgi:hypothetical protein
MKYSSSIFCPFLYISSDSAAVILFIAKVFFSRLSYYNRWCDGLLIFMSIIKLVGESLWVDEILSFVYERKDKFALQVILQPIIIS